MNIEQYEAVIKEKACSSVSAIASFRRKNKSSFGKISFFWYEHRKKKSLNRGHGVKELSDGQSPFNHKVVSSIDFAV